MLFFEGRKCLELMFLYQAIVWIKESEARVARFTNGIEYQLTIRAEEGALTGEGKSEGVKDFFERVARALDIADEILIVGPGGTKDEFSRFMNKNDHSLDPRVVGVETIEEPTEGEIAAFATLYFARDASQPKKSTKGNGNGEDGSKY
jgi:stalled ribosome rescue protein Dom34